MRYEYACYRGPTSAPPNVDDHCSREGRRQAHPASHPTSAATPRSALGQAICCCSISPIEASLRPGDKHKDLLPGSRVITVFVVFDDQLENKETVGIVES
jgi:hypothetical protein